MIKRSHPTSTTPQNLPFLGNNYNPTLRRKPPSTRRLVSTGATKIGFSDATILQGKELSYNNLVDLEAARRLIAEFPDTPLLPF
jgi:phosphoribosylaminoimidazolecarboxamide formyltransferase/IMP cyclohydrolase